HRIQWVKIGSWVRPSVQAEVDCAMQSVWAEVNNWVRPRGEVDGCGTPKCILVEVDEMGFFINAGSFDYLYYVLSLILELDGFDLE
ncbi:hypothetical protein MMC18_006673, partial [Xylographa bjoerkii]|nr:hypothetical protein [Xylographa bjoerkii]